MKKLAITIIVIVAFGAYAFHQRSNAENVPVIAPPSTKTTPGSTSNTNSSPSPTATSYKDGSYTGDSVDAYYGYVQVKATISGGKITDVQFLDYPQDRQHSIDINSQAMPYLKEEAISAQSANVDIISGATQTSRAFQESLQSALDQAKA